MYCDIVILPPPAVREQIGQAVRTATRHTSPLYAVDNRALIPHLSLYHIHLPKVRLEKLAKLVQEVAKHYHKQVLASRGLRETGKSGASLCLYFIKSKPLEELHRRFVRTCRSLRIGEMPWTSQRPPTSLEVLYRKRYGTQHVLRFFNPHVTLCKIERPADAKAVAKQLQKLRCRFVADTIAITEVNFWHQVTRVIKKFTLT